MKAVYAPACACELIEFDRGMKGLVVETFATEAQAIARFRAHQAMRGFDDNHRYWIVHGPGGHVIAVQ